jgi:putative nucleotidyltransferase with HDIG domain
MTEEIYNEIITKLQKIIKHTEWEGRVFAVGGCIRDLLLRREIKDIDLAIEYPEGGIKFTEWLQNHNYTQGSIVFYQNYGTSMFRLKGYYDYPIEAVCTRKERYPDPKSRNPETAYGTLREDCFRRDLTINALYQNISTGKIIDLTGGISDMRDKILRTTSDPDVIFEDDPLRILRVIRFWGKLGEDWTINPNVVEGISKHRGRLGILSLERIQTEFSSIITSPRASRCLILMRDLGILETIFPEIQAMVGCKQGPQHFGDVFEHTLAVIDKVRGDLKLRLAALLHDSGKPICRIMKDNVPKFYNHENVSAEIAEKFLREWKYPNDVVEEVCYLVRNHMLFKQSGLLVKLKKLRKYQYQASSKEMFERLLELIDADNKSHAPEYCLPDQVETIRKMIDPKWFSFKIPVSGEEIMEIKGIEPGPLVRSYKEYLLRYSFSHPDSTREDLLEELRHVKPNNLPR